MAAGGRAGRGGGARGRGADDDAGDTEGGGVSEDDEGVPCEELRRIKRLILALVLTLVVGGRAGRHMGGEGGRNIVATFAKAALNGRGRAHVDWRHSEAVRASAQLALPSSAVAFARSTAPCRPRCTRRLRTLIVATLGAPPPVSGPSPGRPLALSPAVPSYCACVQLPATPLDDLIERLGGPSKVAELTGRNHRQVGRWGGGGGCAAPLWVKRVGLGGLYMHVHGPRVRCTR